MTLLVSNDEYVIAKRPHLSHQAKCPYQPHQALVALPTLPTPVMLSEAKHLSVSTDREILHYVQNDIVSE